MGRLTNPAWIKTLATTVERLGFSTIWAPEHVVLLKEYASRYPYSGGDFPIPRRLRSPIPFITLTYATACTSRVRLATECARYASIIRSCWPRSSPPPMF